MVSFFRSNMLFLSCSFENEKLNLGPLCWVSSIVAKFYDATEDVEVDHAIDIGVYPDEDIRHAQKNVPAYADLMLPISCGLVIARDEPIQGILFEVMEFFPHHLIRSVELFLMRLRDSWYIFNALPTLMRVVLTASFLG